MQEMTEFVDVLPTTSLKTCLAFVTGKVVTKSEVAIAAVNLLSYTAGQFIPLDAATRAASEPMSHKEAEAYLKELVTSGATAQKIGDGKLLELAKLLLPFLLKFLI